MTPRYQLNIRLLSQYGRISCVSSFVDIVMYKFIVKYDGVKRVVGQYIFLALAIYKVLFNDEVIRQKLF